MHVPNIFWGYQGGGDNSIQLINIGGPGVTKVLKNGDKRLGGGGVEECVTRIF